MRKKFIAGILTMGVLFTNVDTVSAESAVHIYKDDYTIEKAKQYALKHAEKYNPRFYVFDKKRDCTSFVSQCVMAGGMTAVLPDKTPSTVIQKSKFYWFNHEYIKGKPVKNKDYSESSKDESQNGVFYTSTSFIRTDNCGFYEYMRDTRQVPTFRGIEVDNVYNIARVGDVIQIEADGDSVHSVFVVRREEKEKEIYCASHTSDYKEKSLADIHSSVLDPKSPYTNDEITYKVIRVSRYK